MNLLINSLMNPLQNTIVDMLNRFIEISVPIKKALDDPAINKRSLFPDDEEIEKIEGLLNPLNVVRDGTVSLQGNDVNLATADEVR